VKDNSLSFQNIGRNLKYDHGKALKNWDKVGHVLEQKCGLWDICGHLVPEAEQVFATNSRPELGALHWYRFLYFTIFFHGLGCKK